MTKRKVSGLLFRHVFGFAARVFGLAAGTFGFTALALACALHPPLQNGAAAVADGVQVALLRQSCSQTVEADWPGNDLVEATVEVQVHNGAATPVSIRRDGFRLGAANGSAVRPSTWGANEPMSLAPGQTQTFQLRFMSRGGLSCSAAMTLESPAAVTKGDRPVNLAGVQFTPELPLSGYGASAS
jgi:hypothetical protein